MTHEAIAASRGHEHRTCPCCLGTGTDFDPRTCDTTPCPGCLGSGMVTGRCECGELTQLVTLSSEGGPDAEMVCPQCAVTCCEGCDRLSVVSDLDGASYCAACFAALGMPGYRDAVVRRIVERLTA